MERRGRVGSGQWKSELVRENIAHPNSHPVQHGLQFVERKVMFSLFDPVQRHGREAGLFAELGV